MSDIERYIQFAIDNGYDCLPGGFDKYEIKESCDISIKEQSYWGNEGDGININGDFLMLKGDDDWYPSYSPLQAIITSKPFIEAIAIGIIENSRQIQGEGSFLDLQKNVDEITIKQAIAIRDNKLNEFINNLI